MGVFTKLEQFFLQKKNRSFLTPILAFFERTFNKNKNCITRIGELIMKKQIEFDSNVQKYLKSDVEK